jgi:hypothetical protein
MPRITSTTFPSTTSVSRSDEQPRSERPATAARSLASEGLLARLPVASKSPFDSANRNRCALPVASSSPGPRLAHAASTPHSRLSKTSFADAHHSDDAVNKEVPSGPGSGSTSETANPPSSDSSAIKSESRSSLLQNDEKAEMMPRMGYGAGRLHEPGASLCDRSAGLEMTSTCARDPTTRPQPATIRQTEIDGVV